MPEVEHLLQEIRKNLYQTTAEQFDGKLNMLRELNNTFKEHSVTSFFVLSATMLIDIENSVFDWSEEERAGITAGVINSRQRKSVQSDPEVIIELSTSAQKLLAEVTQNFEDVSAFNCPPAVNSNLKLRDKNNKNEIQNIFNPQDVVFHPLNTSSEIGSAVKSSSEQIGQPPTHSASVQAGEKYLLTLPIINPREQASTIVELSLHSTGKASQAGMQSPRPSHSSHLATSDHNKTLPNLT